MTSRTSGRLLRTGALTVMLITTAVILILPGTKGCPPRVPSEFDPLECQPSAFTAPRLIVFAVGLAIAVTLWVIAFVRDIDT